MLKREWEYYQAHLQDFLKEHTGEFVVIKDDSVKGFFSTEEEAFKSMAAVELGTYFVKRCVPIDQDVVEYHSRVVFF